MVATLIVPAGWLNAALEASSVPYLLTEPAAAIGALGLDCEPQAALQKLRDLEQGGVPRIVNGSTDYRVVDVERTDGIILYYARQMAGGGETGRWAIFFQEGAEDPELILLSRRQIWDSLLKVYTDTNLHALPEEVTYSRPTAKASHLREDGAMVHEISLQNGHGFSAVYGSGYGRPSINGLMKFLGHVPLCALTQIDEIRMVAEKNAIGASTLREGKKLVNIYYPMMDDGDLDEGQNALQFYRFLYTVHHETYGHGLMYHNRFLRREMIKIVASGEPPPSDYARSSIEEWFPEGVAERGVRLALNDPQLADWDRQYPYLSGLIRHLLAVMEETAEPANENIALWKTTLRGASSVSS